jgi:hypothetical protein
MDFATDALLDLQPPHVIQIDGNLGGTAAAAEMPMQRHGGVIGVIRAPRCVVTHRRDPRSVSPGDHLVDIAWWSDGRVCDRPRGRYGR